MKFVLLFCFLLYFTACSSDDNNQNTRIVGIWQLTESITIDENLNAIWVPVEDGYTYTFKSNGEFESSRFTRCSTGNYSVQNGLLILDFGCENFTTEIETPPGTFKEKLSFKSGYMILKPEYLSCIEGCGNKFEKIK